MAANALDTLWSPLTDRDIRSTKTPDFTRSKEASLFIMGDVCCAVIHGTVISVFYNTAVKSFGNTVQFVDISINDQSSVLWQFRKSVERTADIIQILEEIQMILVNIENNAYLWKRNEGNCWCIRRLP